MEETVATFCDISRASSSNGVSNSLVARTGRHQQRYERGYRLVAGCVPFRYRSDCSGKGDIRQLIEVLMITTQGGPGLLFPKGGWETDETAEEAACREAYEEAGVRGDLKGCLGFWDFKSKRQQGDCSPEGLCRAVMFALVVTEVLDSWPEKHARERRWVTAVEAIGSCRYEWMQLVLEKCLSHLSNAPKTESVSENKTNSEPVEVPSDFPVEG